MRTNDNLQMIKKHLEGEFERQLFDSAIYNLLDVNNQLRFSNYAYALRELFLHVIKRMAPDKNVQSCDWFPGLNEREQVARKDSYKYIIQGGLSDEYVREEFDVNVAGVFPGLRDAFNSLNKFTHISENIFPINDDAGLQMVGEVEGCISALFTKLDECHKEIINKLYEAVSEAAIHSSITETVTSIDILSTHSSVDEVYVDDVKIVEINDTEIVFSVTGSVGVGLQWGSNFDLRNDIGAVGSETFPFTCEVRSPVYAPESLECDEGAFHADTSSWWEGYYD
ncbi:hypothetical protein ACMUBP_003994 [Cronobacter sakazakii]